MPLPAPAGRPSLPTAAPVPTSLADRLDAALPQTQCTRCGYPDCRAYAEAIASGSAGLNRCPPGGQEGIERLAALTGRPALPLDASCGHEGPLHVAVIDETWCIGCTLCIKACPVDCIAGAAKQMHTVIEAQCTGCELCLPVCPVDCISLVNVSGSRTGWAAWSEAQAAAARDRYARHRRRRRREAADQEDRLRRKAEAELADLPGAVPGGDLERKRATIEAVLAKARERRGGAA